MTRETTDHVNTYSRPSQLEITDLRIAKLRRANLYSYWLED